VLRRSVRDFVVKEVLPIADVLDSEEKDIPEEIIKKMAELGYFGLVFPEEVGGVGLDHLALTIVSEELSRGWLSVGSVLTRNLIAGLLIQAHGSEEQKKRFLPGITSGELLTAAAFTEPDAGSDTAGIKTRARRDGDRYLLTGAKTWCTFANSAHVLTVLARTDPDPAKRHKGLSLFLLEKKPGDEFDPPRIAGEPIPTIGYHGMHCFTLGLQDCPVPAENLIGGAENKGFYQLMAVYESARIQTAARAVGGKTADALCRGHEGHRPPLRLGGGDGQTLRRRYGGSGCLRSLADPWGIRVLERVFRPALLAGRQTVSNL
jgi:(2S)-methylsuccinyl-CoA dehydrogenase